MRIFNKVTRYKKGVSFENDGEIFRIKKGLFTDSLVYSGLTVDVPKSIPKGFGFLGENSAYLFEKGENYAKVGDNTFFGLVNSNKGIKLAGIIKDGKKDDLFVNNKFYQHIGFLPFNSNGDEVPVFFGRHNIDQYDVMRLDTMDKVDIENKWNVKPWNIKMDNCVLDEKTNSYLYEKHYQTKKGLVNLENITSRCVKECNEELDRIINKGEVSYLLSYNLDGGIVKVEILEDLH
jgi:hypothetical protein